MYVYGLLSHKKGSSPTGNSHIVFHVDDNVTSNFTFKPDGVGDYTYNALLFSVDNLTHTPHRLVFDNGWHKGPTSLLLFDYLIYTTYVAYYYQLNGRLTNIYHYLSREEDSGPPTPEAALSSMQYPSPTEATSHARRTDGAKIIAPVVLISLLLSLLAVTGAWYLTYRRKRAAQSPARSSVVSIESDIPNMPEVRRAIQVHHNYEKHH